MVLDRHQIVQNSEAAKEEGRQLCYFNNRAQEIEDSNSLDIDRLYLPQEY